MLYDNGQLQNGNLGDYMIPRFEDMLEITMSVPEHLEANEIHGLGETSLPPVMPVVSNRVCRAKGVRITDLPITPEKILRGLREQRAAAANGRANGRDARVEPMNQEALPA